MATVAEKPATVDDLYLVEGKAELVDGRIVQEMPTGWRPSKVASRIFRSLDDFAEATGHGDAFNDNFGYVVGPLVSGRHSFSPDASFFLGQRPDNLMRFLKDHPTFAVEVRSEGDYGEAAEAAITAKRADYFEAGTLVVWDVDPVSDLIRKFRLDAPERPEVFHRGQVADAEPAVVGWRLVVDRIFA